MLFACSLQLPEPVKKTLLLQKLGPVAALHDLPDPQHQDFLESFQVNQPGRNQDGRAVFHQALERLHYQLFVLPAGPG